MRGHKVERYKVLTGSSHTFPTNSPAGRSRTRSNDDSRGPPSPRRARFSGTRWALAAGRVDESFVLSAAELILQTGMVSLNGHRSFTSPAVPVAARGWPWQSNFP